MTKYYLNAKLSQHTTMAKASIKTRKTRNASTSKLGTPASGSEAIDDYLKAIFQLSGREERQVSSTEIATDLAITIHLADQPPLDHQPASPRSASLAPGASVRPAGSRDSTSSMISRAIGAAAPAPALPCSTTTDTA